MLKHHHTLTTALVMHAWESKVCLNPVLLNLTHIFYSTKLVNIYYLLYVTKLIFSIVVSIFFEFIVFFLYTKICICDLTSEMFPTFFSLCRNDMLRFFIFLFHTFLLSTRQILFSLLCSLKFFHQCLTVGAGNRVGEWEKSHDLVSWSKGMCQSERALYILGFFSIVFRDNHILNNKTNSTTNRRVQQRRLVIFPSLILLLMLCWNFLECLYVCILVTYRPNTHTHTPSL